MLYSSENYISIGKQTPEKLAMLPLGAIEQHGPHLAVSTDTDIVTRIAQSAERRMPDDIVLCPTLPFGSSHHHLEFGGTLSISPELYTQVICGLVSSLLQNGFRKIVLLNGHGGNITPVKQALSLLSNTFDKKLQPNIALVTYWELAGDAFSGAPPMESYALSHACEYETSLMLHLYPEKVLMSAAARAERPENNGYIPWEDDLPYRGVFVAKQTGYISGNGSSGEPQKATTEKGKFLFEQTVYSLIQFLSSFKGWPLLQNLRNKLEN